ncbi:hypothetical protein SAMN05421827_12824 [Pedobacter terrae]|uniref:Uncharacterized protein n=1 Tax=Pedobacter terrae TaxID=405671 RepID=A0A1G8D695_9SPHI|nr:hypothetical protein [Pedobacter terrae]SDH53295.1 hypothetical protein SAMN05421827_12824 [Pedobacter terrae]
MEVSTESKKLMESIIGRATQYADSTYKNVDDARIAAKGFAVGYQEAYNEKSAELKELAGIVKALLPGIGAIPSEKLKVLEEYIAKKDAQ